MKNEILVNDHTLRQLERISTNVPHAILIWGDSGAGQLSIAKNFVTKLNPKADTAIYDVVATEDKAISVELAREIRQFLRIKQRSDTVSRVVIIDCSGGITNEAQNALLKVAEEPPAGSLLIIVTDSLDGLLDTLVSRLTVLHVLPVSFSQARQHYSSIGEQDLKRYYTLAGGQAALLDDLVHNNNSDYHQMVGLAKKFITSSQNERLQQVHQPGDLDPTKFVKAVCLVAKAALESANIPSAKRKVWLTWYKAAVRAELLLASNVSKKIVLVELALQTR